MNHSEIREVLNKDFQELETICSELESRNHGCVKVVSSNTNRIKDYVIDGKPVFVKLNNKVYAVVGEDESGLVILDSTGLWALVPDRIFENKWNGEAVYLTGEPYRALNFNNSFVIYDPIQSNWDSENNLKLFKSIEVLQKLDILPKKYLPSSPVILTAKKPSKEERKDHQVAHSIGVNITVLQSDNILEAVLHEIGHVYWNTVLTDTEKDSWKSILKNINIDKEETVPKIIKNPYELSNGEELFCTTYAWYMLGLIFNEGYFEILKNTFLDGYNLLENIFMRREKSIIDSQNFRSLESLTKSYIKHIMKEPILVNLKNKKLFKAFISNNKTNEIEQKVKYIASDIPVGLLKSSVTRSYFQVLDGKLKDMILITDNRSGEIDWEFMKSNPNELKLEKTYEFTTEYKKTVPYANCILTLCKAKGKKLPEPMRLEKTENGAKIVYSSWRKLPENSPVVEIKESKPTVLEKAKSLWNWLAK
jgi:hypothetical protein